MKIILKQDIANLGHKHDVLTVKDGYARNYLIPKKMAVVGTPSVLKAHEEVLKQWHHKEVKLREEAEAIVKKLEGLKIVVGAKTSSTGKIFGSVNNIQIAETLEKEGITIDRRNIKVDSDKIKEIGTYEASIKVYRDIKTKIQFEVIKDWFLIFILSHKKKDRKFRSFFLLSF